MSFFTDSALVDKAIERFDAYTRYLNQLSGNEFSEITGEVRKRLNQMRRLLQRICAQEDEKMAFVASSAPPKPTDDLPMETWLESPEFKAWQAMTATPEFKAKARDSSELTEEMELNLESFYWVGGRGRTLIRMLPGLKRFEAQGVRNNRNHLIEHAEQPASGVMTLSMSMGGAQGPVLKGLRLDTQRDIHPDAGLYPNAVEYFSNLLRRIENFLANPEVEEEH